MWSKIAEEMTLPLRPVEAMHWEIGELGMAQRAGVTSFRLSSLAEAAACQENALKVQHERHGEL
jgi:hypothetical protein